MSTAPIANQRFLAMLGITDLDHITKVIVSVEPFPPTPVITITKEIFPFELTGKGELRTNTKHFYLMPLADEEPLVDEPLDNVNSAGAPARQGGTWLSNLFDGWLCPKAKP